MIYPLIPIYNESEAETVTELLLDSPELYKLLERALKGERSSVEFLIELQQIAEVKHEAMERAHEEERALRNDPLAEKDYL